jgi:CheY-like chemotaxis protein
MSYATGRSTRAQLAGPRATRSAPSHPRTGLALRLALRTLREAPAVVVVEDEETVRNVVACYLGDVGFRVFASKTADEGLALVTETGPLLVLADLVLPRVPTSSLRSGIDILWALRRMPWLGRVPFVLMTGYPDKARAIRAQVVADEFAAVLEKPLVLPQLLAIVQHIAHGGTLADLDTSGA